MFVVKVGGCCVCQRDCRECILRDVEDAILNLRVIGELLFGSDQLNDQSQH